MPGLFLLSLLCSLAGQETTPAFHSTTKLVRVEVRAVDSAGKPLMRLVAEDLEIRENDLPQKVDFLAKDELPLDLMLLIDVSGSMNSHIAKVARNAIDALAAIKQGDRVGIMAFNSASRTWQDLTFDKTQVASRMQELAQKQNFGGGTMINTPIYDAAQLLRANSSKSNRRAILILTDGQGQKGTRSSAVLNELWEGDITLNALIFPPSRFRQAMTIYQRTTNPLFLLLDASVSDLVDKSSGELLTAKDSIAPLLEIIERIRRRYTAYYVPPVSTKKHRTVFVGLSAEGRRKYPDATAIGRKQYETQ